MKKSLVITIIVAAIVLAVVGTLIFTRKATAPDTTNSPSDNMGTMEKAPNPAKPSPSTSSSITIQNFAFSPASTTVKKGTTVTWTNQDSTTHTVTETDSQTGPDSGDLAPGKSYSFTYSTVGTFKYHCTIHASMTGTVTVTE